MLVVVASAYICAIVHPVVSLCYYNVEVRDDDVIISSPGYTYGINYDVDIHCSWNIRSETGIAVHFNHFDVEYHYQCEWDYVLIYDGECGSNTGHKYCGKVILNYSTRETTVCIEFRSDHIITRKGFQATVLRLSDLSVLDTSLNGDFETTVSELGSTITTYSAKETLIHGEYTALYIDLPSTSKIKGVNPENFNGESSNNLIQPSSTLNHNTLPILVSPVYLQSSSYLDNSYSTHKASVGLHDYRIDTDLETSIYEINADLDISSYGTNADLEISSYGVDTDLETSSYEINADLETSSYKKNADIETYIYGINADLETSIYEINADLETSSYEKNADIETSSYGINVDLETSSYGKDTDLETSSYKINNFSGISSFGINSDLGGSSIEHHSANLKTALSVSTVGNIPFQGTMYVDIHPSTSMSIYYNTVHGSLYTMNNTHVQGSTYVDVHSSTSTSILYNTVHGFVSTVANIHVQGTTHVDIHPSTSTSSILYHTVHGSRNIVDGTLVDSFVEVTEPTVRHDERPSRLNTHWTPHIEQTFSTTELITNSDINSFLQSDSSGMETSVTNPTTTEFTDCTGIVKKENDTTDCGLLSPSLEKSNKTHTNRAYVGEWPWMVGIQADGKLVCGGSLLSDIWVVTAGHCLTNFINLPHLISVVIGSTSRNGSDEDILRITDIVRHPLYDSIYRADIALLRLQTPVEHTKYIKPICLRTKSQLRSYGFCFVAGWGIYDSTADEIQGFPDSLKSVKVDIWNHNDCLVVYPAKVDDTVICAGNRAGGYDTCKGDSGGPLMCVRDNTRWELVGIMSWGEPSCNGVKYPGVYTNVQVYYTWIESVIRSENQTISETCDFESFGICGIKVISRGSFSWTKRKAGWTYGGQPTEDRTTKTNKGHYIFADSFMALGKVAIFEIKSDKVQADRCLRFWYIFHGKTNLQLMIEEENNRSNSNDIFTITPTLSGWQKADIGISREITIVRFMAFSNKISSEGGVAIDDISLTNGQCTGVNDGACNFDRGQFCGYTNSSGDIGKWITHSSPEYRSEDQVLLFDGKLFPVNTKAILISPRFHQSGPRCFTFQYKICGNTYTLSVIIGYIFSDVIYYGNIIWTSTGMSTSCSDWKQGEVNIPSMPIDHFVAIRAQQGKKDGSIFIDTFRYKTGICN